MLAGAGLLLYLLAALSKVGVLATAGLGCFIAGYVLARKARRAYPDDPLTVVGLVVNGIFVMLLAIYLALLLIGLIGGLIAA